MHTGNQKINFKNFHKSIILQLWNSFLNNKKIFEINKNHWTKFTQSPNSV